MDAQSRSDWAKQFERISRRISDLADELRDNKNIQEFISEMERHKTSLERDIASFKEAI